MRVVNMVVTSHDFISGLKNCLKFSQLLSCLDEAMQTWKKSCISYIVYIAASVTVRVLQSLTLCLERYRVSPSISAVPHQKNVYLCLICNDEIMHIVFHFDIPS